MEYECRWCGYSSCPSTLHCCVCGYDFGICSEDPYADPTCPRCEASDYEQELRGDDEE
jgi:hypothetical protein